MKTHTKKHLNRYRLNGKKNLRVLGDTLISFPKKKIKIKIKSPNDLSLSVI